jgi:uncharacterized membrane protein YccC
VFTGKPIDVTAFKLARKNAFVALANLSDNFQRMLSEPKDKQPKLKHYHQFVAINHMLTSHIAGLSYYAQTSAAQYAADDFQLLVQQVDLQFREAVEILQGNVHTGQVQLQVKHPISNKIQELLAQKKATLDTATPGDDETAVQQTLAGIKTITDQFALISTITVDEIRVLQKIVES